jgi:hypothetical protein
MKLTKGKIAKIFKKKNESHKVLNKKIVQRNLTYSNLKKKQFANLHNKTLKKFVR